MPKHLRTIHRSGMRQAFRPRSGMRQAYRSRSGMRQAFRPTGNSRTGAVLVEFAVVLPIIMLCFASMIEFSRVLMLQHTADTAAYEAARAAMVPGATAQDAKDSGNRLLTSNRLKTTTITVEPPVIVETTSVISVRVDIPVANNSWLPPFWFTGSTVSSEVSLICERPPMVQLTGLPAIKAKAKKGPPVAGL